MWPLAQHTDAIDRAEVTLHVWPGNGQYEYYEDDGMSLAYQRGSDGWRRTTFGVRQKGKRMAITVGKSKGGYPTGREEWQVVVHGVRAKSVSLDEQSWPHRHRAQTLTFRIPDDGQRHGVTITKV